MQYGPFKKWRTLSLALRSTTVEWTLPGVASPWSDSVFGLVLLDPSTFDDVCDKSHEGPCIQLRAGGKEFLFRCSSDAEVQIWVAKIRAQAEFVIDKVRNLQWSFVRLHVYHLGQFGVRALNFLAGNMCKSEVFTIPALRFTIASILLVHRHRREKGNI